MTGWERNPFERDALGRANRGIDVAPLSWEEDVVSSITCRHRQTDRQEEKGG